jgi:hypothetical protein
MRVAWNFTLDWVTYGIPENDKVDQSGGVLDTDQRGGYPGPLIESTGRPHE